MCINNCLCIGCRERANEFELIQILKPRFSDDVLFVELIFTFSNNHIGLGNKLASQAGKQSEFCDFTKKHSHHQIKAYPKEHAAIRLHIFKKSRVSDDGFILLVKLLNAPHVPTFAVG